jgi:hypothetical protein
VAFTEELSPKFQLHDVGVLVELSVNVTVSGAVPEVGVPVKFATGVTTPEVTVM